MSRKSKIISPLEGLLPYQRKWIDDEARFKIGLMARQTGKSWTSAMEAVRDCLERKTTWVCMSAGEDQALEWMRKAHEHTEAFKVALAGYTEERDATEALLKKAVIEYKNGSRIIARPANPATARGYSANLLLDEFAHHEDPDAIWRAIYPSISNPMKGLFKVRVVSTPNGLGNKFAGLWQQSVDVTALAISKDLPKGTRWSGHRVDIYDAVKFGLAKNSGKGDAEYLAELREGMDDPEGWAQEYECQFLDAAAVLLPYELIAGCESAEATTAISPEWWASAASRPVFIGWDFARKKDLSVPWIGEQVGDVLHAREVIEYRGMSTPDQVDAMRSRIKVARRVSVDYTGPGIGLGDLLVKEFQQYDPEKHLFGKIELVTFTNAEKLKLFPALRVAFEQHRVRVPINRAIREDLHSMQRVATPSGNVTYRAPHTADGHADRCTALALCLRAAGKPEAQVWAACV